VQRLAAQLIGDRLDDFRMPVADVENAEAAQTVDVFFAGYVAIRVWSGVGPFDRRRCMFDRRGFAIFEKAGVDVVAERCDRFLRNPRGIVGRDARFGDQG
jgi:hypothetical protein